MDYEQGTLHTLKIPSEEEKSRWTECILQCTSFCCGCNTDKETKYQHIKYRPSIDSTLLSGFPMPLEEADKILYYPQERHIIYPKHRRLSSVIDEEPRSGSKSILVKSQGRPRFSQLISITQYPSLLLENDDVFVSREAEEPILAFSLFHDIQTRVLHVRVNYANNLDKLMPSRSTKQKSNTCVVFFLMPDKDEIKSTTPRLQTNNPSFDEAFYLTGVQPTDLRQQMLVFHVHDDQKLIGIAKVELDRVDLLGEEIIKCIKESSEHDVEVKT